MLAKFIQNYLAPASFDEAKLVDVFNALGNDSIQVQDANAMVEGYNSYLMKFKIAMLSNCGFVNYDVDQNVILEHLLNESGVLNFEIV